MSAKAERMRTRRHAVAAPGSARDTWVKIWRVILPSAIGALAAFLILAPLTNKGEVSFLLDKDSVEIAKERLRVNEAEYRGSDNKGRAFSLKAGSAVQRSSALPVVEMEDLLARIALDTGPAELRADEGSYNMDAETVEITGPIEFESAGGYGLVTRDVDVDLNGQRMESRGAVTGRVPSGTFRANKLVADLDERRVVLEGGARLRMQPGSKGLGF
ncbi:LPS export ABC transporter periplasmic protein LptC [Sphingorhabdus sp. Alg239-R122]|uniref:LPS export ABC transporter periplasmic protein LptC n=1 Tax=Sphingorhabdus sp. Alg239-R122 TaxID=2305989 RepID=UPI0013DC5E1D|nr:LPS export ABC transporter periplasmic protein LptC [Sphingorhabdus sp. Alg239-R122]